MQTMKYLMKNVGFDATVDRMFGDEDGIPREGLKEIWDRMMSFEPMPTDKIIVLANVLGLSDGDCPFCVHDLYACWKKDLLRKYPLYQKAEDAEAGAEDVVQLKRTGIAEYPLREIISMDVCDDSIEEFGEETIVTQMFIDVTEMGSSIKERRALLHELRKSYKEVKKTNHLLIETIVSANSLHPSDAIEEAIYEKYRQNLKEQSELEFAYRFNEECRILKGAYTEVLNESEITED